MKTTVVNDKPKEPVEFRLGMLVRSTETSRIILVTNNDDGDFFSGVDLTNEPGDFSTEWRKENFEIFDGAITLEND